LSVDCKGLDSLSVTTAIMISAIMIRRIQHCADVGMQGTIRMHQERDYPGRVSGTCLRNPDFCAYARAFGGFGATVEPTADFADALKAARQSGKPAIIHLKIDPEAITPATTLSRIRAQALAKTAA
jgi:acetolactate synthase-1/2/3 large subunit